MDFEILDNGTAIATAEPEDASGNAQPLPSGTAAPQWTVTDSTGADASTSVLLTPSGDGLSCTVAPANPPVDGTGFQMHVAASLPDGTVIREDAASNQAFDIVAAPHLPTKFAIALSNPGNTSGQSGNVAGTSRRLATL